MIGNKLDDTSTTILKKLFLFSYKVAHRNILSKTLNEYINMEIGRLEPLFAYK